MPKTKFEVKPKSRIIGILHKTTKILIFFSLFTFHFSLSFSQPTQQWVATYSNPYGNYNVTCSDMTIDTNGNIFITGTINTTNQGQNFITIKYNSSGVQQWAVEYNGPGSNSADGGVKISTDKIGNVYVTGISEQTGLWTNVLCTIKYNSNGVQQWVSRYIYNPNPNNKPTSLSVDDSGNVIVAGQNVDMNNMLNYVTIKYNSNGDSVWVRKFRDNGIGNGDFLNSMCLDNFGNVYVTGSSYGGTPGYRVCTIKYSSTGVQQWINFYNNGNPQNGAATIKIDTVSNSIYVGGSLQTGSNNESYLLIKYNNSGIQQWFRTYHAILSYNDAEEVSDIGLDVNQNIYLTGLTTWDSNYTTLKYNFNGDSLWVRNYFRATGNSTVPHIAIDKYNNVYLTGNKMNGSNYEFSNLKYNTSGTQQWLITYPGGGNIIKVDKYLNIYVTGSSITNPAFIVTIKYSQVDGLGNLSDKRPYKNKLFDNYPNPFNNSTRINYQLSKVENVKISIVDILGQVIETLINKKQNPGIYDVNWKADNYSSGIYFCKMEISDPEIPARQSGGNSGYIFSETKKLILIK